MTETRAEPQFAIHTSRLFASWLAEQRLSIAFTTYQAGKIFMLGLNPDGSLSVVERTFPRAMGLAPDGSGFWLASLYQLWRFENFLGPGERRDGYDAHFVPVKSHVTGDIDVHDIAMGNDGQLLFVATLFNCIATTDDRNSFRPLWRPPFIDRLAAEDRCHLNGLAIEDGRPRFATAVGQSNVADGWRDHRQSGGLVIDIPSGEVVARGLSMPHSPRLHEGQLWLLNAGTGELGRIDVASGTFEPVAFLPGFLRGLAIVGRYAIAGLSKPRENRSFTGLSLDERLAREGSRPRCGLRIVDLHSGDVVHTLDIEGVVEELYDVMLLPGVVRPMLIGLKGDAIRFQIRPAAG
jgi:uncharacterized protein (TIGR03032 family)